jgi:hypothetical protein
MLTVGFLNNFLKAFAVAFCCKEINTKGGGLRVFLVIF